MDILRDMFEGMTSREMAKKRRITLKSISTHRRNILKKMGLPSTVNLVIYLYERHLAGLQEQQHGDDQH